MNFVLFLLPIVIFFVFARFTKVEEATAKAVMSFGKFRKFLLTWKGHWIDKNYNIWEEGEKGAPSKKKKEIKIKGRIFGGLFFYGFWPFHRIYSYPLRWTDIRMVEEAGEKIEKPQFHDEPARNFVMLKPAVYWTKLFKAETKPPERFAVDAEVTITMRVFNPYLFLFKAPPTPLEDIMIRISSLLRSRVGNLTSDELIILDSRKLWDGWSEKGIPPLKEEKFITETLPQWGVKVVERGVEIKKIDFSPEVQKALALKKERELEAFGRAEELTGSIVKAVALVSGLDEEKVREEFRRNPEEFFRQYRSIVENVMKKIAMEEQLYFLLESKGEGEIDSLLKLIAAWKRLPVKKEEKAKKEEELKEKETKEKETKEKEEKEEINIEGLTPDEKEVVEIAKKKGRDVQEALQRWREYKKRRKRKEFWGF